MLILQSKESWNSYTNFRQIRAKNLTWNKEYHKGINSSNKINSLKLVPN